MAAEVLRRLYGNRVELVYIDADDLVANPALQETLVAFAAEGWPLPVTLINNQLFFSGSLRPDRLVAEVARIIKKSPDSAP